MSSADDKSPGDWDPSNRDPGNRDPGNSAGNGSGNGSGQPSNPRRVCARTDAVLAVHLDGDLERESFDREACEPLGYGFVSDDSLHTHLRECATCQLALQRARRLDAALASMAGRAVADQVTASGCSLEELSDQWLNCAAMAAADAGLPETVKSEGVESEGPESEDTESEDTRSEATNSQDVAQEEPIDSKDLDWLFDRALQSCAAQQTDRDLSASRASRIGTLIAIAGVMAACFATWLCIATFEKSSKGKNSLGSNKDLGSTRAVADGQATGVPRQATANQLLGNRLLGNREKTAATQTVHGDNKLASSESASSDLASSMVAANAAEVETDDDPASSEWVARRPGGSLARSMHAARNRELPEQRTAQPTELSHRIRDRALGVPKRLAAAHRLLRATRAGSSAARFATDQLLLALAACGDLDHNEIALHEQLLDEVRSSGPVLVRLEHRLVSLPSRNRDHSELDHKALAAILVAARVENDRLDQAIRRALRRNDAIADVVASALRCGVRANGSSQLLLDCWHDQVAIGKQEDTQQWAEFWFRGQAATSFAQLKHLHARSHSAPERVRCLLAMGCVSDDSTLPRLLAELAAPRRIEACAAACGLASLPHRVLKTLLPKANLQNAGLLRAALARAGMPESKRWIEALALSKPQLQLMRTGSIIRFSEVAAWFRKGLLTAD